MTKEIDDYINEQVANNRGTREQIIAQFANSNDSDLVAYAKNVNKPKQEEAKQSLVEAFTTKHPVLGVSPADIALYGGGSGLALAVGAKAGGALVDKIFGQAGSSVPPVPTASTQDMMQQPTAEVGPAPVDPLRAAQIRKAEADALHAENRAQLTAQKLQAAQPKPAGTPVAAAETVANVAPETARPAPTIADLKAKVEAGQQAGLGLKKVEAPVETAAAPITSPTLEQAVEKPVEGAVAPKKRAPKEQKTFKTAADIPEGYVFRPDVGNLDRSMGNILGKEHREYARELFSGGKPFGHSDDLNADVSRLTTEYFKRLQQEVPETILGREARIAQKVPSEFGTFAKGTNFGKAAKVAGVAGTLISVADLANAKTAQDKATAGTNLLGAVLPPFMDINDVGAPGVGKDRFEEAYKLGSPYAQTEEAKKSRLKEKAGAGRGIAPPSAYMR
jgi:hypothetical protein